MLRLIAISFVLAACTTTTVDAPICAAVPYDNAKCADAFGSADAFGYVCDDQGSDAAPDDGCQLLGDFTNFDGSAQSVWCCAGSDDE